MSHRLLFVCMGNICRSPTAKGLFDQALFEAGVEFESESAGTHDYHVGSPPDPRAVAAARRAGAEIGDDIARRLIAEDFRRFDRILVMDRANLESARALRPADATARLQLVMELAPDYGLEEVPDPYYGGEDGFVRVVDMLQTAARAMVRKLAG
jgi:protein-tyrosine phosphatase